MELLIRLEHDEPPTGTVVPVRDTDPAPSAVAFVGWLGLLRVLAEVIAEPDSNRG